MNDRYRMRQLLEDESGQDLIEYALVAGLLGLATVATLKNLASNVGTVFSAVGTTLTTAV
jgi:pilus assembly protein Flp/PilA